jgi:outer membrane protein insertion porin family
VAIAPFFDMGINPILRKSQLKIGDAQFQTLKNAQFGCPTLQALTLNCVPTDPNIIGNLNFKPDIPLVGGTNFQPRISTGLELQVFLPVVNAPFRIYYAYNPLRLDDQAQNPLLLSPDKFRALFPAGASGDFSAQQAIAQYGAKFQIREPRKTFRFTVATTF